MSQKLIPFILLLLLLPMQTQASDPITIDGLFTDWVSVPNVHTDASGDGDEDFAELKITNDNDFLFLKFRFHNNKVLLQDLNSIRLFIDTDNNNQSGLQVNGIGAELEWCFGCREGIYHSMTGQITISQSDIILRSAPTITSKEFEMAVSLHSAPMTSGTLQPSETISVVFQSTNAADIMPDQTGGLSYKIDTATVELPKNISLLKNQENHIRVLTYNTLRSGLFFLNRQDRFKRIISTLNPDIMAFQEQSNASQVKLLVSSWLVETQLFVIGLGNNNVVLSKYPVLNQALITESRRTMAALLDTRSALGYNLLIINSHLACCTNNESRQNDADEIIEVLRDWRGGNGPFLLPENTPIIHLGDFNLVGDSQQLTTLTDGDIVNETTFGSDFLPDWDNTPLTDLFSRHTAIRMGYTWRSDRESFNPGKLDYILYTDSNIEIGNHFVLNTLAMPENELSKYGLLRDDTNIASDHLPRVMDIATIGSLSVEEKPEIPDIFYLFPAYPNPFNSTTNIKYTIPKAANVSLKVFDVLGNHVKIIVSKFNVPGTYYVQFDGTGLASGVYFYRLDASGQTKIEKFLLIK